MAAGLAATHQMTHASHLPVCNLPYLSLVACKYFRQILLLAHGARTSSRPGSAKKRVGAHLSTFMIVNKCMGLCGRARSDFHCRWDSLVRGRRQVCSVQTSTALGMRSDTESWAATKCNSSCLLCRGSSSQPGYHHDMAASSCLSESPAAMLGPQALPSLPWLGHHDVSIGVLMLQHLLCYAACS